MRRVSDAYTSIAAPVEAEIEIKRSRFLARLEPVTEVGRGWLAAALASPRLGDLPPGN